MNNNSCLLKYPKLLSRLLYGNASVEEITQQCINFAQIFNDTEKYIPELKIIIPKILQENDWNWVDDYLQHSMAGLFFVCNGADGKWKDRHGEHSKEALLIQLSHLCYRGDPSISSYRIGLYALGCKDKSILTLLLAASFDLIFCLDSSEIYLMVFLHIAFCHAMNMPAQADNAMQQRWQICKNIEETKKDLHQWKINYDEGEQKWWRKVVEEYEQTSYEPIEKELNKFDIWMKKQFSEKVPESEWW